MYYIIFDLEWNNAYNHSLHRYLNEIIEIGAVKLDENLNIADTFKQMVIPKYTGKLSNRCKKLTKITPEEISENGIDFKSAFSDFSRWSSGRDNVFMSWSNSDLYVLSYNFLLYNGSCKVDFMNNYCDVQKYCMSFIVKDGNNASNQISLAACADTFGVKADTEKFHRALSDCLVTAECFKKVYDKDRLSNYIKPCDSGFFERLLFKPYYITEADSELFNVYKHTLTCPVCDSEMKPSKEYIVQNKAFKGAVKCRKCRKTFWVFIRAKKTYDEVLIKEHFVEMNKKKSRKFW